MMKRTTLAIVGLGLVVLGMMVGHWLRDSPSPRPDGDAFEKVDGAYRLIQDHYVDSIAAHRLTETSIQGMLTPLDSYSVYLGPDQMKQVEETFRGSFEGIGITYELVDGPRANDTIAVSAVIPGGPSAKAGLRAGDRILQVDQEDAVGWTHDQIRGRLKGPQGSTVSVTLRRPGRSEPVETQITRDEVSLETVSAAYMIQERTGYVRLRHFSRSTPQELRDAIQTLESDGMNRLVLDLRGNAGGLMTAAEEIADEFLVGGQLIVTARSRHEEFGSVRHATSQGVFEDRPLIVLVDEQSASASEIVAGALQDHDRALLVGRRTFGKGLVQRQFGLRDESGLRLTVARFYTPSGRLLQRREGSGSVHPVGGAGSTRTASDSVLHRTDAGRRVMGGGGIQPDHVVEARSVDGPLQALEQNGLLRSFMRRWMDPRVDSLRAKWGHRPDAFVTRFDVPASLYSDLAEYAAEQGVQIPDSRSASVEGPTPERGIDREADQDGMQSRTQTRSVHARRSIEVRMKALLGQRLFGPSMLIRVENTVDPTVNEALQSWTRAQEWASAYPVAKAH